MRCNSSTKLGARLGVQVGVKPFSMSMSMFIYIYIICVCVYGVVTKKCCIHMVMDVWL